MGQGCLRHPAKAPELGRLYGVSSARKYRHTAHNLRLPWPERNNNESLKIFELQNLFVKVEVVRTKVKLICAQDLS